MWIPVLRTGAAPLYDRLADAMASDIGAGSLAPGDRLPPQRELAYRLGLSVGTVSRAYAEGARRGVIRGEVGRGSFVVGSAVFWPTEAREAEAAIDLARNLPPLGPARAAWAKTAARFGRRSDLADCLAYAPGPGLASARRAGADWLARTANFQGLSPERLICTAGAQQAVAVALITLCRPGDAVIVEQATFYGVKMIASQLGLRLAPTQMDAEGLTPDGLAHAARESGARVAYVLPLQNPTARLMSAARRHDIAETARRLDLTLIEDDLYAPYAAEQGLEPLAALAPERVFYVSGLSKSLAPGLRVGYLAPPPGPALDLASEALRSIAFGPATFGAMLATDWIERGEAFEVLAQVKAEMAARVTLARATLGAVLEPTAQTASPHLWLPVSELRAERVAGAALRRGVELTPPGAPFVAGEAVTGLRICLGGPADRETLQRGLAVVRDALDSDGGGASGIV